jgi:hypothetical protein
MKYTAEATTRKARIEWLVWEKRKKVNKEKENS